jgi:hypothetical protein
MDAMPFATSCFVNFVLFVHDLFAPGRRFHRGPERNEGNEEYPHSQSRIPAGAPKIPQRFLGNPQRFQRFHVRTLNDNGAWIFALLTVGH